MMREMNGCVDDGTAIWDWGDDGKSQLKGKWKT